MDQESDVTLTEHLPESENMNHNEPARVMYYNAGVFTWEVGDYEVLDEDPSSYLVECSCGETFSHWGIATEHVDNEHH